MDVSDERTLVHARVADVTYGRGLDHVADGEALDGLVLADAARAVRAADEVDVTTSLLVAASGASLLGLSTSFSMLSEQIIEEPGERKASGETQAIHPLPARVRARPRQDRSEKQWGRV